MATTNAISKAERNALSVSYEVLGTTVELDLPFVKNYLVRGNAQYVSEQEIVFFMNTCRMNGFNPLANGEVYLVKYSKETPAQIVIGKGAYMRRAYEHPEYISMEDGITVQRGNSIVQKEGCCLYPGETLVGAWCRILYVRNGVAGSKFKEVAFSEYNKGQATWKAMPATMINKVAISQCARDAFPREYKGVYSEEELIASGAIPPTGLETTVRDVTPIITQEQRKELFDRAQFCLGANFAQKLREMVSELGYSNTHELTVTDFEKLMKDLNDYLPTAEAFEIHETSEAAETAETEEATE